ncbi:MAG: Crp/Fnr family transcriptional regulator [Acidimicrobiales bacterium]
MGYGPDEEWEGWIDAALAQGRLGKLGESLVGRLLEGTAWREIPARQRLDRLSSGEVAAFVVRGMLRLYVVNADGKELTVDYARPGQAVGLSAVVGPPHPFRMQTVTDTALGYLRVSQLGELAAANGRVGLMIAAELADRLRGMLDEITAARFGKARQRLARHILELGEPRDNDALLVRASQADLAGAIGSTREAVAKTLRDLREAGLARRVEVGWIFEDVERLYAEAALERLEDRRRRGG